MDTTPYSASLEDILSNPSFDASRSEGAIFARLLEQAGKSVASVDSFGRQIKQEQVSQRGLKELPKLELTAEQIAANKAVSDSLAGASVVGSAYKSPDTGKAMWTSALVQGDKILSREDTEIKKPSFGTRLFEGAVTGFLGAAFGGALGLGPLAPKAAGSGLGSFGSSLGKTFGAVGRNVVSGAVQGGINSGIRGGDILKGAVSGGLGAGVSSYVSPMFGSSMAGRAATGAVTSGVVSKATGGDPFSAAVLGAIGGANIGRTAGLDGAAASFVNDLAKITAQVQLAKAKQQRTKRGG